MGKNKRKDHEVAEATETSGKMSRKEFEKELAKLQVELTRLQTWVRATGARVIVVFEGRDKPALFVRRTWFVATVREGISRIMPSTGAATDRRIVNNMLDLMPARALIFHEWDAHGTCSGLGPQDYFDTVRKARAMVTIPSEYLNPQAPLTVTPREVIDNFVKTNEGLSPANLQIDCDRTRLREVRICLSRELRFRNCTGGGRSTCRSEKVVMPPTRGLYFR